MCEKTNTYYWVSGELPIGEKSPEIYIDPPMEKCPHR